MTDLINVKVKFENAELQGVTNAINRIGASMRKNCYKLAGLLYRVESERLFVDDGFTSTQEYAEKVFNIKKTTTYNLLTIGELYTDSDKGDASNLKHSGDKDFTLSQLSVMLPLEETEIRELTDTDKITPDMSVRAIKSVVKEYKEEHTEDEDENVIDGEAVEKEIDEDGQPVIEWSITCYKDCGVTTTGSIPQELADIIHGYLQADEYKGGDEE